MEPTPQQRIRSAVGGLRLLGLVMFGIAGCLFLLILPKPRNVPVTLTIGAGLFLVAPGTIYQLAAIFIARHESQWASIARIVAIIQAACPAFFLVVETFTGIKPPEPLAMAFVPSMICVVFTPALLAQAWAIHKSIRAMRLLPPTQVGFELMPVASPQAVIAVQEEPGRPRPADRGEDAPALLVSERSPQSGKL